LLLSHQTSINNDLTPLLTPLPPQQPLIDKHNRAMWWRCSGGRSMVKGPNVSWATGKCFFSSFFFFCYYSNILGTIRPTKAHDDQRRPTQANDGQRWPTQANAGPSQASEGIRWLTKAHGGQRSQCRAIAGQRRPTTANASQRRPTQGQ